MRAKIPTIYAIRIKGTDDLYSDYHKGSNYLFINERRARLKLHKICAGEARHTLRTQGYLNYNEKTNNRFFKALDEAYEKYEIIKWDTFSVLQNE